MAQAPLDGTYFNPNNVSFTSSLWVIKPGTLEDKVQILWNGILNTWFPPTQPYKIGIETAVLTDNTEPDGVVFEIRFNAIPRHSGEMVERQIFMLECKKIGENISSGWQSTEVQLLAYMEANSNHAQCGGLYGACEIGRKY